MRAVLRRARASTRRRRSRIPRDVAGLGSGETFSAPARTVLFREGEAPGDRGIYVVEDGVVLVVLRTRGGPWSHRVGAGSVLGHECYYAGGPRPRPVSAIAETPVRLRRYAFADFRLAVGMDPALAVAAIASLERSVGEALAHEAA